MGWDDLWVIVFWIVVFTGLRVIVMEYLMRPLANAAGIQKKKLKTRFAEQAWVFVYYGLDWSLGMVLEHRCAQKIEETDQRLVYHVQLQVLAGLGEHLG